MIASSIGDKDESFGALEVFFFLGAWLSRRVINK